MALTYAQIVTVVTNRLGGLITEAGLTNDHFESCVSWGVRVAGGSTASYDSVTNAEIAAVADPDYLIDLVELCIIKTIIGNLDRVDWKAGPISEKSSQVTGYAVKLKENKEKQLEADYGYGVSELDTGYIDLAFAEVG